MVVFATWRRIRGIGALLLAGTVFLSPAATALAENTSEQAKASVTCPATTSEVRLPPPPPSECTPPPPPDDPGDPPTTAFTVVATPISSEGPASSALASRSIPVKVTAVRGLPKQFDEFKQWLTGYRGYVLVGPKTALDNNKGQAIKRDAFTAAVEKGTGIKCQVTLVKQSKWKTDPEDRSTPTFRAKQCSLR